MGDGLAELSAHELLDGYAARAFSPVEVVDALAARMDIVEPHVRAFVTPTVEQAREKAGAAERAWAEGRPRRLEGVPFAAKDLFDSAGVRTTYGSRMFADHVPSRDARAVARAKQAGAIMIGKTSTHEFAWGVTSYNAAFDAGRNPWAHDVVSGGSSGGSSVALATRTAPLGLGSDTGGSIRIPAAFCGVVGLKPTFGVVPTDGVFPLAPSLDHAGPLARTPADAALLLSVIGGVELAPDANASVARVRVAVCPDLMPVQLAADVSHAWERARRVLEELGALVVEVALPYAAEIRRTFGVVQAAEALQAHRQAGLWPDRRDEYGPDVRSRVEGAERVTLDAYVAATISREHIRAAFGALFREADLLLTPVAASSPVAFGSEELEHGGRTELFRELVLPYTTPQNLAGLPACALRAGFDARGVPVGVQLTGPAGGEQAVVAAASAFFAATPEIQSRWPADARRPVSKEAP